MPTNRVKPVRSSAQPENMSDGAECLARMFSLYTHSDVAPRDMVLVAEGASGRCIMRCSLPECAGIIGIYWTAARADNASFLPAAAGLSAAGVPVPRVFARQLYAEGCGACLTEDLGERSLLSLRHEPQQVKLNAYVAALRTMQLFHSVHVNWSMQPPFDAALYAWEQAYFAEHLLGHHLGLADAAATFSRLPACRSAAAWLAGLPRVPVHRDFQSQNIILRGDKAYCIDFQGMRAGLAEYDLASLLYDPYMELSDEERMDLLRRLSLLPGASFSPVLLQACALQRLMQASGAFANIGYNQHLSWYLSLIPSAMRTLRRVCSSVPSSSPVYSLATCIADFL